MQDSCITVQEKVVVPNIPVVEEEIICPQPQIDLLRAKFEKDSLLSLFNRLPDFTNSNSRTINIVDNPGTSELMEEDIKIATDKNWVVITK